MIYYASWDLCYWLFLTSLPECRTIREIIDSRHHRQQVSNIIMSSSTQLYGFYCWGSSIVCKCHKAVEPSQTPDQHDCCGKAGAGDLNLSEDLLFSPSEAAICNFSEFSLYLMHFVKYHSWPSSADLKVRTLSQISNQMSGIVFFKDSCYFTLTTY